MLHPAFEIGFEAWLGLLAVIIFYIVQRLRFNQIQHILRTPSSLRHTIIALITSVLFLLYHGYLIASQPEWFIQCSPNQCHFHFLQGLAYLTGYHIPPEPFTEVGNHSRIILLGINMFTFAVTIAFYFQHLNEQRRIKIELLKLQRTAELLLIKFNNPSLDLRDDFIELAVNFDLATLHFSNLNDAIIAYRDDRSAANLNKVVDELSVVTKMHEG